MQSRNDLDKSRLERLKFIIRHAYERAPAVRNILDSVNVKPDDIQSLSDLERIPVTKKDELLKLQREVPPFGGFLATPVQNLEKVFVSPGPIYDPQTLKRTGAMAAEAFSVARVSKGDIVVNAFTYHMVPAGHWMDEALRSLGATVVPTGVGNTELQAKVMHDLGVTGYAGTASFLLTIIKKAEEMGYDFRKDFKLRFALVGAERLSISARMELEFNYAIQVIDSYGTAELGIIAYNCERKQGLHMTSEAMVEIADPATGRQMAPGEIGEVVVTSFDEAYPLIRLGTGDLAVHTSEPCGCERSSNRIVRIVGRVGEAVKVRGMFVHPQQLEQISAKVTDVVRYQLLVDQFQMHDTAVLKVELIDSSKADAVRETLISLFPQVCTVRLDRVDIVASGSIPSDAKVIVDNRKWD
jgi:phenylacetate-CoA ligase